MLAQEGMQLRHSTWGRRSETEQIQETSYQVQNSQMVDDPIWDAFLNKTAGGSHVQSSTWAKVKAIHGWQAERILITQNEEVVAGTQLLMRPLPIAGNIGGKVGYVTKGPIVAKDDPELVKLMMNALCEMAYNYRIQHLVIQPSNNGKALEAQLPGWKLRPSTVAVAPTATILVDLTTDLDKILSRMRKKTRRYVRQAERSALNLRQGVREDLPAFHRLVLETGERQGFTPYSLDYFQKQWDILHPHGQLQLFMVEHEGQPVSAQMVTAFGDTVMAKTVGWSGEHSRLGPNYLLDWGCIQWAKEQGYLYYDLEGINPQIAKDILYNDLKVDHAKHGPLYYKLGFGGEVVLFPGAYDYIYNPLLRNAFATIFPKIANGSIIKQLLNRFRTG